MGFTDLAFGFLFQIRSIVDKEESSSSSSSSSVEAITTTSITDGEGWTEVVSKKRKKKQKEKKEKKPAVHNIEEFYGDAKPSFELKVENFVKQRKTGIKIRDVQNLVMWILADGMNSDWIFIKNKPLVKKVVLVMLTSLGEDLFTEKAAILPTLRSFLPHAAFPTGAPGSKTRIYSPMSELLNRPVKKPKNKKAKTESSNLPPHIEFDTSKAPVPPSSYILSQTQLVENKYPLNDQETGYVSTTEQEITTTELVGVDCEMCTTAFGLELTRVTLVNQRLEVMYDKLVKPTNPIINYNTRFSGIDEGTLRDVTTTLKDVQTDILRLISSNTILVGHSLENDLCALKMVHKRVIDTALLYPHPQGLPYKQSLKNLSQMFLKQAIQMDHGGHDSIEDARAALKLTLLKISKGPSFGDSSNENETTESILKVLHNHSRKCTLLDRVSLVRSYSQASVNSVPCLNDEEVQERLIKALQTDSQFIWAQFHNLSSYYSDQHMGTKLCPVKENGEAMTLDEVIQQLDQRVQRIVQSSPPRTLLIFTTGSGNGSVVKLMNDKRGSQGWTSEDETKLETAVTSARKGMSFLYMT